MMEKKFQKRGHAERFLSSEEKKKERREKKKNKKHKESALSQGKRERARTSNFRRFLLDFVLFLVHIYICIK